MAIDQKKDFYKKLDLVFLGFVKMLNNYVGSTILQNCSMDCFESFIFANLTNNFFLGLNQTNIIKLNLPRGKIKRIKTKYKDYAKRASNALHSPQGNRFDSADYQALKNAVKKDFPEFVKIAQEIEKAIDFADLKEYLKDKKESIRNAGKANKDFNDVFTTQLLS